MEKLSDYVKAEKLYEADKDYINKCLSKIDISPVMPFYVLYGNVYLQKLDKVKVAYIDVNGKEFISIYKKVTMGKVFYKVYSLPTSAEEFTIEESIEALNKLHDAINFLNIVVSKEQLEMFGMPSPDEYDYKVMRDYVWCDPSTRFSLHASNFRKKYDINKYRENLSYRELNYNDEWQFSELFGVWKSEKVARVGKFSTPEFDCYLEEFPYQINLGELKSYGLFFDDKLIAADIVAFTASGERIYFLAGCNYSKHTSDLIYAENIGQMLFYYECEYFKQLGIKSMCGGTHSVSGKGVQQHKDLMYKNVSPLYNVTMEEFNERENLRKVASTDTNN